MTTERTLTHDGRTQTIAEWSRETGLLGSTIKMRIDRLHWSVERALTTPRGPRINTGPRSRRSKERAAWRAAKAAGRGADNPDSPDKRMSR